MTTNESNDQGSDFKDQEERKLDTPEMENQQIDAGIGDDRKIKMPIFKRILWYAAIVISSLFLLLGLAGIIGGWAINKPLTDTILAVLVSFDEALHRMEEASSKASAALSESSAALEDADQRLQEAGEELADTSILLEVISRLVGEDIQPNMDQTAENIRAVYDTVVAIEEAIAAINTIPFVDLEIPGGEEVASIRTGMEEMAVTVSELREEVQQRREERAEKLVERISAPVNTLNSRVEEMETKIIDIEARLGLAIERIDQVQSRVPLWIDVASILNTLLFGWFMFSQGAVIVLSWRALHPSQEPVSG